MVTRDQKKRYFKLEYRYKKLRKSSNKKMARYRMFGIASGAILGIGIAISGFPFDGNGTFDFGRYLILVYGALLLAILFNIPHILIHEAGHLVFGLMTGYEFLSFRVLKTIIYKKNGRLHKTKHSVKGTAGQCLMRPPRKQEDGSFPFVLYNLGGGIANLAASLVLILPMAVTNNSVIRIVCLAFALMGVLVAVTNLIPISMVIQNDGMNVKSMLQDESLQEAFYLQLQFNAQMSDGKKLTEYPPDAFKLPAVADETNTLAVYLSLCAYIRQLARQEYELAEQSLQTMEEHLPEYLPAVLNALQAERLFFLVLHKAPPEEIAALYKHIRLLFITAKTDIGIQRIRYVYETFLSEEKKMDIMTLIMKREPKKWVECDKEKLYQEFLKVAGNYPVQGLAAAYVDIVEDIRKAEQSDEEESV